MIEIRDAGDLRKYRTEIPNIVYHLGLTPYELTLYNLLKRTAGANGQCRKSTDTLAVESRMSKGMVSKAKIGLARPRSELNDQPLIVILAEKNKNGGKPKDVIEVTDIWEENMAMFSKRGSECDSLKNSARRAAKNTNVPRPGDEPSGVKRALLSEVNINKWLINSARNLLDAQFFSVAPVRNVVDPEKLTIILSRFLREVGQDCSISDSSVGAAMIGITRRIENPDDSLWASSLHEFVVHCANVTSSPGEIGKEPSEERTLKEEPPNPQRGKVPRRPPTPEEVQFHSTLNNLLDDLGSLPPRKRSREAADVKWMLDEGYDADQMRSCRKFVASDPWWNGKLVTWSIVAERIGKWIDSGKPLVAQTGSNGHKPAEDVYDPFAQFRPKDNEGMTEAQMRQMYNMAPDEMILPSAPHPGPPRWKPE